MGKKRIPRPPLEGGRVPVPKAARAMTKGKPKVKRGWKNLCPGCGTDLSIEEEGTSLIACPECGFMFRKKYRT